MNLLATKILAIAFFLNFSNNLFAHVELDYPTGGETLTSGTAVTIQWHITISHITLNWDLLYSPDGGMTWEAIQMDIPPGELSFIWQVPAGFTNQARVSIIQDNEGQDYQDESMNFTIESTSGTLTPSFPDFNFNIFPNPANELLNVEFDRDMSFPLYLTLFDIYGSPRWSNEVKTKDIFIPVNDYPSGQYFLQIKTAERIYSRKVIVE